MVRFKSHPVSHAMKVVCLLTFLLFLKASEKKDFGLIRAMISSCNAYDSGDYLTERSAIIKWARVVKSFLLRKDFNLEHVLKVETFLLNEKKYRGDLRQALNWLNENFSHVYLQELFEEEVFPEVFEQARKIISNLKGNVHCLFPRDFKQITLPQIMALEKSDEYKKLSFFFSKGAGN